MAYGICEGEREIYHITKKDILAIEHIGSTSVEGLDAKPLIDMMIGVKDLKLVDHWIEPLQTIEYEYIFHENFPQRRFLEKVSGEQVHIIYTSIHMGARVGRQFIIS